MDLERRLEDKQKDYQSELNRDLQKLLAGIDTSDNSAFSFEKRIAKLELDTAVNVDGKLNQMHKNIERLHENTKTREIAYLDSTDRVEKLELTLREYVELIEALNEKLGLQQETLRDTRNTVYKKLSIVEKNVLE